MARHPHGPRKVHRCLFCDFTTVARKRAGSAVLAEHIFDRHLAAAAPLAARRPCLCGWAVTRASFLHHCVRGGGLVQHLGRAALGLPDE